MTGLQETRAQTRGTQRGKCYAASARQLLSWFHAVHPGNIGRTRLKVMVPDTPLLLPPVKL